jgi:F-type H+-transporting ATPase subunit c
MCSLLTSASVVSAGLAIGISTVGPGLGQGRLSAAALDGLARQPESEAKLRAMLLLSLAFTESLTIYGLVVALCVLYANPLLGA